MLTCLDLEYTAGWPHCLVLTDKCLARYKAIFHLFLQLRRAVWALERTFSLLKAAGESGVHEGELWRWTSAAILCPLAYSAICATLGEGGQALPLCLTSVIKHFYQDML